MALITRGENDLLKLQRYQSLVLRQAHCQSAGHERAQAGTILAGKPQTELAAPPKHVVLRLRPFLLHQVAHFGAGEIAAKRRSKIVDRPGVTEHTANARAVGVDHAPRLGLDEERPGCESLGDEGFDALDGKLAPRKAPSPGPRA